MSERAIQAVVRWWTRRVGATPFFDADDARQEARIAIWQAEQRGRGAHAYRRTLDAMRSAIPGFRQRAALQTVPLDEAWDVAHNETPEHLLIARQQLAMVDRLPAPERAVAQAVMAGQTYTAIAAEMGISEVRVGQLLTAACRRLVKAHGLKLDALEHNDKDDAGCIVNTTPSLEARIAAAEAAAMYREAMEEEVA